MICTIWLWFRNNITSWYNILNFVTNHSINKLTFLIQIFEFLTLCFSKSSSASCQSSASLKRRQVALDAECLHAATVAMCDVNAARILLETLVPEKQDIKNWEFSLKNAKLSTIWCFKQNVLFQLQAIYPLEIHKI